MKTSLERLQKIKETVLNYQDNALQACLASEKDSKEFWHYSAEYRNYIHIESMLNIEIKNLEWELVNM
jgi:hypothetical protein